MEQCLQRLSSGSSTLMPRTFREMEVATWANIGVFAFFLAANGLFNGIQKPTEDTIIASTSLVLPGVLYLSLIHVFALNKKIELGLKAIRDSNAYSSLSPDSLTKEMLQVSRLVLVSILGSVFMLARYYRDNGSLSWFVMSLQIMTLMVMMRALSSHLLGSPSDLDSFLEASDLSSDEKILVEIAWTFNKWETLPTLILKRRPNGNIALNKYKEEAENYVFELLISQTNPMRFQHVTLTIKKEKKKIGPYIGLADGNKGFSVVIPRDKFEEFLEPPFDYSISGKIAGLEIQFPDDTYEKTHHCLISTLE